MARQGERVVGRGAAEVRNESKRELMQDIIRERCRECFSKGSAPFVARAARGAL
jgi:hypothetical protein